MGSIPHEAIAIALSQTIWVFNPQTKMRERIWIKDLTAFDRLIYEIPDPTK